MKSKKYIYFFVIGLIKFILLKNMKEKKTQQKTHTHKKE